MEGPLLPGENIQADDLEKLSDGKPERRPAPEASELHGYDKAHEHIGQVLLTAEASAGEKVEKTPEKNKTHIATLNRAELLALSEKIMVDGTSLRQIYETHLVGERGLRRLVAEYLNGGNVKKSLRREIVEHEIDFERDPALRDLANTAIVSLSETASDSSKATFEYMVEKASIGLGDKPQVFYGKPRTLAEAQDFLNQPKNRRLLDVSFISIIAILIIAIVILLLARH